ncbi:plant cysteine oxidase 2-like [Humulus lupulus]|uniref:plant cysteine oxidase 2-like n=1 Tax=Humulus lupulus TaxID=3486 RepID=UPI002B4115FD|nr:plant cysteine oxidase 2-like [Humulus lupulus]
MEVKQGRGEVLRPMVRHVSRVGYVKKGIVKRKNGRLKRHMNTPNCCPEVPMATLLQELFLSCCEVFKGPNTIPLPCDVTKLCQIIDKMKAEDVGLSSDIHFFNPTDAVKGTPQRVTYTTIYQCNNFSICIFFIPTNGVIPLHNHPGMTVFSKLLLGNTHIKSYDWVDQASDNEDIIVPSSSRFRLAKLKANSVFRAPCNTSVLYPTTGGNIHEFRAITPCAVLDVIGPPYSKEDGRDCSYYKDHPYSSYSTNGENSSNKVVEKEVETSGYAWLEEIEMAEECEMDVIEYMGPQIMDNKFRRRVLAARRIMCNY